MKRKPTDTPSPQPVDPATMPSKLLGAIEALDREPFRRGLADAVTIRIPPDKLQAFAEKAPDRYAQYLIILAKLNGYGDRVDLGLQTSGGARDLVTLARQLNEMSDLELEQHYQARFGEPYPRSRATSRSSADGAPSSAP